MSKPKDPPVQPTPYMDKPSAYDLAAAEQAGITRRPAMMEAERHNVVVPKGNPTAPKGRC